jgi:hypothetical protein
MNTPNFTPATLTRRSAAVGYRPIDTPLAPENTCPTRSGVTSLLKSSAFLRLTVIQRLTQGGAIASLVQSRVLRRWRKRRNRSGKSICSTVETVDARWLLSLRGLIGISCSIVSRSLRGFLWCRDLKPVIANARKA